MTSEPAPPAAPFPPMARLTKAPTEVLFPPLPPPPPQLWAQMAVASAPEVCSFGPLLFTTTWPASPPPPPSPPMENQPLLEPPAPPPPPML